jgi:drug/metabolite transporter (DMT)-like permease
VLALLVGAQARGAAPLRFAGIVGPLALFAYAAPFSFAYLRIGAAVGALVLFGVVQLTMIGFALFRGERPALLAWFGIALALLGLALLTLRSAARPDPLGLLLMAVAGVAWGAYTLVGRAATDPLAANARSFLYSAPVGFALVLMLPSAGAMTPRGLALALISGALTSGLGYAVWYRALPRLSVTRAAVAQLTVPIIAAVAAIGLLGEHLSARLVLAGSLVLAGVALVLVARAR